MLTRRGQLQRDQSSVRRRWWTALPVELRVVDQHGEPARTARQLWVQRVLRRLQIDLRRQRTRHGPWLDLGVDEQCAASRPAAGDAFIRAVVFSAVNVHDGHGTDVEEPVRRKIQPCSWSLREEDAHTAQALIPACEWHPFLAS